MHSSRLDPSAKMLDAAAPGSIPSIALANVTQLGAVALQLAATVLVIRAYQIETVAFRRIFLLCCGGLAVHHFLPQHWRLSFFAILSLSGIVLVFGLVNALWIVGLGMGLLALFHVPAAMPVRLTLLSCAGVLFAMLRGGWISSPVPEVVWPILGSMFMFRIITYGYDLATKSATTSLSQAVAYFFMLPNVCFTLFPVIDYKTFCRTYRNDDRIDNYQVGIRWILRGLMQLIMYRVVYQIYLIRAADVDSIGDLLRFMSGTYLLYLQVSGQFHIIIGMMRLYGFGLPETHRNYLLASSFTDYWRRINIYWKDFIMKLFFNPAYFRLKRFGPERAIVFSTIIAFVATWALHSYQWFWLRGSFLVVAQDMIFWVFLAVLVVANVISDFRSLGRHAKQAESLTFTSAMRLAARTLGVFLVICIVWSMWTAESFSDWFALLRQGSQVTTHDIGFVLLVATLLGGSAILNRVMSPQRVDSAQNAAAEYAGRRFWQSALAGTATAGILLAISQPQIHAAFGNPASTILLAIRTNLPNARDMENIQRGYYEDLVHVDRFSRLLDATLNNRPNIARASWMQRETGDYRRRELVPAQSGLFRGAQFTINRWGFRDQEYTKEKKPGVYRAALLGGSRAMGWGVADEETFETIVESAWNMYSDTDSEQRSEILNFSMNGYGPVAKLITLETAAFDFQPDLVFYVSHRYELDWIVDRLADAIERGVELPYAFLTDTAELAELPKGTRKLVSVGKLKKYAPQLLATVYRQFVENCHQNAATVVWLYVPEIVEPIEDEPSVNLIKSLAADAGFIVVDLKGAYEGVDTATLHMNNTDFHPNAHAHQLLASRFLELVPDAEELASPLFDSSHSASKANN